MPTEGATAAKEPAPTPPNTELRDPKPEALSTLRSSTKPLGTTSAPTAGGGGGARGGGWYCWGCWAIADAEANASIDGRSMRTIRVPPFEFLGEAWSLAQSAGDGWNLPGRLADLSRRF